MILKISAGYSVRWFTYIILLNPQNADQCFHSHFTDEDTEEKRKDITILPKITELAIGGIPVEIQVELF